MTETQTEILAMLDQLIRAHGPKFGLTGSSYDGDNNDGSLCFRFGGQDWIIASRNIEPND